MLLQSVDGLAEGELARAGLGCSESGVWSISGDICASLPMLSLILKEASPCLFPRQQCFESNSKVARLVWPSPRGQTVSLPQHSVSQGKLQAAWIQEMG